MILTKEQRREAIKRHRKECGGKLQKDSQGSSTCYRCNANFEPAGTAYGYGEDSYRWRS